MFNEISHQLKQFIKAELLSSMDFIDLKDSDPLLTSGIIDSLGIVKILAFIKENFGINIEDEEIVPDNFQTIESIVSLIRKKLDFVYNHIIK